MKDLKEIISNLKVKYNEFILITRSKNKEEIVEYKERLQKSIFELIKHINNKYI